MEFRFSLRSLLVVTMLIAVLLGLFYHLTHRPIELPPFDHGDFDSDLSR
jgi:hypothetical protein